MAFQKNCIKVSSLILLISVLITSCGTTDSNDKDQVKDTISGTWRYNEPPRDYYIEINLEDSVYIEHENDDYNNCHYSDKYTIEKVEGNTYEISSSKDDYSRRGIFKIKENGELSTDYYNEDYNFVRTDVDPSNFNKCN